MIVSPRTERRTRSIHIKCTPTEYEHVCNEASEYGFKTLKDFILRCVAEYTNIATKQQLRYKRKSLYFRPIKDGDFMTNYEKKCLEILNKNPQLLVDQRVQRKIITKFRRMYAYPYLNKWCVWVIARRAQQLQIIEKTKNYNKVFIDFAELWMSEKAGDSDIIPWKEIYPVLQVTA